MVDSVQDFGWRTTAEGRLPSYNHMENEIGLADVAAVAAAVAAVAAAAAAAAAAVVVVVVVVARSCMEAFQRGIQSSHY
jgi:hypothetical protein